MTKPLGGLRILDLTHFVAGPWCTMLLADLGADVTKVEPLNGEIGRSMGGVYAGEESAIFLGFNRGKRSVAIDLKDPEGLAIVQKLAGESDIVIHNFRPGTAERLGVDAGVLRGNRPWLIYCAISAFGSDGPYASQPANDPLIQALSGAMSETAGAGGAPTRMGVSVPDFAAGVLAAIAVLAAVRHRSVTGIGTTIDLNLLDSQLFAQVDLLTHTAVSQPLHEANTDFVRDAFLCADGEALWLELDTLDGFSAAATQATGHRMPVPEESLDRPALSTLRPLISEILLTRPRATWLTALRVHGVVCAPVLGLGDVLPGEPDRTTRPHNSLIHGLRHLSTPITTDPPWLRVETPPPRLGEHTRDVLQGLGMENPAIDGLVTRGVVRDAPAAAMTTPHTEN
jgi:crotonobetainyl-CoA:carnitine CoA-transferase CaiB-like acyl-CoA transferase